MGDPSQATSRRPAWLPTGPRLLPRFGARTCAGTSARVHVAQLLGGAALGAALGLVLNLMPPGPAIGGAAVLGLVGAALLPRLRVDASPAHVPSTAHAAIGAAPATTGRNETPSSGDTLENRAERLADVHLLTPREAQIALLMAKGEPVVRIAEQLGIAISTVRGYTRGLYAKMDVHSRQELVRLYRASRGTVAKAG